MCLQSQHSERQQTQQNLMLAGWLLGTVLGTGRSGKVSRGLVNEKSALSSCEPASYRRSPS